MSQISVLKRITTKDQQNCEKFNQIILKKDFNQIFIGRDIDCNYRISSIEISRKHALLEYSLSDNFWSISDLNSTNGLFINAIQLEANRPYRLVDGDRVSFGPPNQSQFCYQFKDNLSENSSNSCVSYELSSINLSTIPVIPIVTRIQTTTSANSPVTLSSSLHFDIEPNQSRTISLTTNMPTRSGLSYCSSTTRVSHSSSGGPTAKKVVSRKASADTREAQPLASFVEHDYSRSSANRSVDKNNKNKRLSSLKLKDNCDSSSSSKSKASKVSEIERKLIAKEKEKLEKSKKSLEQQKTMDRLKFKRKEEELKKKQKTLERKEREAKKKEEEIEKLQKELLKEKKRLSEKAKESEESSKTSAKRKLRSSSTRESLDSKRQCSDESKQNAIEEIFESELTCSICSEYFIQAVNLNCSHTFCQTCIDEWKHTKGSPYACPICREKISNQNRELILDNLIDQFVLKMKPHLKEHRTKLAEERKKRLEKKVTQQNTARMSTTARGHLSRLIPSLHFFLRSTNVSDSESDTDDVDVIGLDFGEHFLSSSSSVSSASSSEIESDSDDSSDDSNSSDDDSVASSHNSGVSSVSRVSDIAAGHTSNDSESGDNESDIESLVSLQSNHSNPNEIEINLFGDSDDSDDSDYSID